MNLNRNLFVANTTQLTHQIPIFYSKPTARKSIEQTSKLKDIPQGESNDRI